MKKKKINKHKLFIILVILIVIATVVFMLQGEEVRQALLSLREILLFGDKSMQPPAFPE